MPYVDPDSVAVINPGDPIPAAWTRAVRNSLETLIDPPACSVLHGTSQTIPDGTETPLDANSENFDNDGMHSTTSNTSRVTAQTPGRYLFIASVGFAPDGNGNRRVRFVLNGVDLNGAVTVNAVTGGLGTVVQNIRVIALAAGDFVEIAARQNSGGDLDVDLHEFSALRQTR